jgi:hypothetical protein
VDEQPYMREVTYQFAVRTRTRPLQASDEQTHDAVNFGDQAKLIGIGVRDVLLERLGEPVPARNLKGS